MLETVRRKAVYRIYFAWFQIALGFPKELWGDLINSIKAGAINSSIST